MGDKRGFIENIACNDSYNSATGSPTLKVTSSKSVVINYHECKPERVIKPKGLVKLHVSVGAHSDITLSRRQMHKWLKYGNIPSFELAAERNQKARKS